jgi:hypothetical protein
LIGVYILFRTLRSQYTSYQNPDYIQTNSREELRHKYLLFLACMLLLSSVFSVMLTFDKVKKMHYILKIPIFSCLGISVTFALTVSIIDIVNALFHLIQVKNSRPPINSSRQVLFCCKYR